MYNIIHLLAYEDGTECSETSAYKIQTPGNYPEENIQHTYRTRRKFEIKKTVVVFRLLSTLNFIFWKYTAVMFHIKNFKNFNIPDYSMLQLWAFLIHVTSVATLRTVSQFR